MAYADACADSIRSPPPGRRRRRPAAARRRGHATRARWGPPARAKPSVGEVGRGQRPGGRVVTHGGGEPTRPFSRPCRDRLPRPGDRGRGLGERQGGGVLPVQPPLGRRTGVPPQPRTGERVLRVIERGGQRGAPPRRLRPTTGVEQRGDRVVHGGYGVPLAVEPVVTGDGPGRGQRQPQQDQPGGPGEKGEGALPPRFGQGHPGADGGGDKQLRTGTGSDGPDGAEPAGNQPDPGEEKRQHDSPDMRPGVRPDQQPGGSGERGAPESLDGGPSAPGPVVDPGEHRPERGQHPEGRTPDEHGDHQQRPGGQRPSRDRTPGNRPALGTERVGEPGRKRERVGTTGHRAPVLTRAGCAFGRRWPGR